MRIVTSVPAMQRLALTWKREGLKIAFVPTMGSLHDGHKSLIQKARAQFGRRGRVVVSIFVNPTQFGPDEDLAKYPRNWKEDTRVCRDAGVDALFAPSNARMYPAPVGTPFSTFVVEQQLSQGMEGASRPTHFRGVATIVVKLFNIVCPDVAVFGRKDFQQAALVKRVVRDLNFPVHILVEPTVREPDGLALSSRNQYLSTAERGQAVALWQAIQQARRIVRGARKGVSAARLRSELKWLIETRPAAQVDYINFFDSRTLRPVSVVRLGTQLALAVFLGKTRLIDNARL